MITDQAAIDFARAYQRLRQTTRRGGFGRVAVAVVALSRCRHAGLPKVRRAEEQDELELSSTFSAHFPLLEVL